MLEIVRYLKGVMDRGVFRRLLTRLLDGEIAGIGVSFTECFR